MLNPKYSVASFLAPRNLHLRLRPQVQSFTSSLLITQPNTRRTCGKREILIWSVGNLAVFRSNQICYVKKEILKKLNWRHGKDFVVQIIFANHQRSEQDDVTIKPLFHFCVVLGKTFLLCSCQEYKPIPWSTSALQRISETQPKVQSLINISNVIVFESGLCSIWALSSNFRKCCATCNCTCNTNPTSSL